MVLEQELEIIKKTIEDFFVKTGEVVDIKEIVLEGETLKVNLDTEAPQLLIGDSGQTLEEIQLLLRRILRRKLAAGIYLDLDINNYRKKKTVYLEELAKTLADEVSLSKKEKELPIMGAQERRIVHLVLSQRQDIMTESRGQEPHRCVVIKPQTRNSPIAQE